MLVTGSNLLLCIPEVCSPTKNAVEEKATLGAGIRASKIQGDKDVDVPRSPDFNTADWLKSNQDQFEFLEERRYRLIRSMNSSRSTHEKK